MTMPFRHTTDPPEPGTLLGQWYIAFNFDTDPGNVIAFGTRDAVGVVNYSGLYVCLVPQTSRPLARPVLNNAEAALSSQPRHWTAIPSTCPWRDLAIH